MYIYIHILGATLSFSNGRSKEFCYTLSRHSVANLFLKALTEYAKALTLLRRKSRKRGIFDHQLSFFLWPFCSSREVLPRAPIR